MIKWTSGFFIFMGQLWWFKHRLKKHLFCHHCLETEHLVPQIVSITTTTILTFDSHWKRYSAPFLSRTWSFKKYWCSLFIIHSASKVYNKVLTCIFPNNILQEVTSTFSQNQWFICYCAKFGSSDNHDERNFKGNLFVWIMHQTYKNC